MSTTRSFPLLWPAGWPRTKNRMRSRFGTYTRKPSIDHGTEQVLLELDRMRVRNVVISANLRLRNDGLPRSGQPNPQDPGIAVYFHYKGEQKVIACDTYDLPGCNLYAIAKTVEALRGIDRWGCSELLDRAFTGFKALPDPAQSKPWWEVLGVEQDASQETIRAKYLELVKVHHPDAGGDTARFQELQLAYERAMQR